MKASIVATAAALLSTTYAETVTLEPTKCLNTEVSLEHFDIELNPSNPSPKYLSHVCGLRIVSASGDVDVNTIKCQAFKDTAGTQPGSAIFTFSSPALIATNPVQLQAVSCSYPEPRDQKLRQRQDDTNGTMSIQPISISPTLRQSSRFTESASASAGPSDAGTITSTTVVTASTGMPSPSGNSTSVSSSLSITATPSQATESPSESTAAAAGNMGVGMGVVAGAIVAWLM